MPEIIVEIRPDGTVTIRAKGFKGAKCLEATAPFEEILGGDIEREKLPEYYEEPLDLTQLRVRSR